MPSSATLAVGETTALSKETAPVSSPEEECRRLGFVKRYLKSDEWDLLETILIDNETHCFLAKTTATVANIDWSSCYTLKIAMSRGPENRTANWYRFFFGEMTATEAANSMAGVLEADGLPTARGRGSGPVSSPAPFRFGCGMHAEFTFRVPFRFGCGMHAEFTFRVPFHFGCGMETAFTFSVPKRTVVDQLPDTQKTANPRDEAMQIVQALTAHREAKKEKMREEINNRRYYAKADDNTNSSSEDFEIILRPGDQGPPMDNDAWRAYWRRRLFERKFGVEEGSKKYEEFLKQPVSRGIPKTHASALTQQIHEQWEYEADDEHEGGCEGGNADGHGRTSARMHELVTTALARRTAGSSAGSRTPALPLIVKSTESGWGIGPAPTLKDGELTYVPYGMLGRIRELWKGVGWPLMWDIADAQISRDVPVVHAVCCNCAGVMCAGEFHCLSCGLHKLCNDCSVAIPKSYDTSLEDKGSAMMTGAEGVTGSVIR